MRLIGPGNVGGRNQQHCDAAVSRRRDQLVNCPVLKNEASQEHEDSQSPEDGDGRNLSLLTVPYPNPPQKQHWQTVYGP